MARKRNLYTDKSERDKPFKLSRSKVDLFLDCPRCFYIDRKMGVGRPPSFPFNSPAANRPTSKPLLAVINLNSK